MNVAVETEHGVYTLDVDSEEVTGLDEGARLPLSPDVSTPLPRVVAAAASGSTVVAVVGTRPPIAVSHDAGVTWQQRGGGLPPGRAVAIADDDPDFIAYAGRNRVYVSTDGGQFWRALAPELPEISAVAVSQA